MRIDGGDGRRAVLLSSGRGKPAKGGIGFFGFRRMVVVVMEVCWRSRNGGTAKDDDKIVKFCMVLASFYGNKLTFDQSVHPA
ncbi:hypothetical protein QQP08_017986 [Theobroma cacao]|nr:hypothetical protein QQP08_017986 [Theobroma cacao]